MTPGRRAGGDAILVDHRATVIASLVEAERLTILRGEAVQNLSDLAVVRGYVRAANEKE